MITFVFAMDQHRLIGKENKLPWHLPADLQHFKKATIGKPVVMGRKTFESIGKPLPGRENIILTRDPSYQAEGCTIMHSIQDVLKRNDSGVEHCVIGGSEIFQLFLPYVDQMIITEILDVFDGDAFFPPFDETEWEKVSDIAGTVDEKNRWPHHFFVLKRR